MVNVPLIRSPSELVDGSEPHGLLFSSARTVRCPVHCREGGGGVPGVGQLGGYLRGAIPGTKARGQIEAYLMNI